MTWQEYAAAWSRLHGGFDPEAAAPVVRGWIRLAYRGGSLLGRLRVGPGTVTASGLLLCLAVPFAVLAGPSGLLLGALLVLLAGFADALDGAVAAREGIPGKPAPEMFLRAAELLGLPPGQCAVIEDAESGVKAGAAGEFGIVVGVDRGVGRAALEELGADVIVDELDELIPFVPRGFETAPSSPPQPASTTSASETPNTREEPA